jgi:hypothetical protein
MSPIQDAKPAFHHYENGRHEIRLVSNFWGKTGPTTDRHRFVK